MASLTTCCSLGAWTPGWLSNAYLVADEPGGTAVFVDSGAPLEPLLQAVAEWRVTPTHVLRTHAHPDHVAHEGELGLPVVRHSLETGDLWIDAIPTPGHSDDMVCFVVNDQRGLLRRHALQGRGRRRGLRAGRSTR